MAHFFGTLQGSRGETTRCGTKDSDLQTAAASWQGAVHTRLYHDADTGKDMAHVCLQPWHGTGVNVVLYDGPVGEEKPGNLASVRTAAIDCLPDLQHYVATHGPGPDKRYEALHNALYPE